MPTNHAHVYGWIKWQSQVLNRTYKPDGCGMPSMCGYQATAVLWQHSVISWAVSLISISCVCLQTCTWPFYLQVQLYSKHNINWANKYKALLNLWKQSWRLWTYLIKLNFSGKKTIQESVFKFFTMVWKFCFALKTQTLNFGRCSMSLLYTARISFSNSEPKVRNNALVDQ